jgi:protein-S-isoprenylcysteine O-methyltransferase Ste14
VRPLIAVWPYALVFWIAFLWAFVPEWRVVSRQDTRVRRAQDAGSKHVIVFGQALASAVGFYAAFAIPSAALPFHTLCFWIGVPTIVAGSLLRRHCFRMLGASFTGAVIVRPDQIVVERGAYRYVRHPSYTAGVIMFVGVGLALGNWISLVVLVGGMTATYAYRVRVEERALLATIGEPYRAYTRRTKRFIPCLF